MLAVSLTDLQEPELLASDTEPTLQHVSQSLWGLRCTQVGVVESLVTACEGGREKGMEK